MNTDGVAMEEAGGASPRVPNRRRLVLAGVVAFVAALPAATTIVLVRAGNDDESGYGPLENSGFSGVGGSVVDGRDGRPMLDRNSSRPAYVFGSVRNAGHHAVRAVGINRTDIIVNALWAPFPTSETDMVFGRQTTWRPFPTTISGRDVLIRLEIREPKTCRNVERTDNPVIAFGGRFRIRWETPAGKHATDIGNPRFDFEPLGIC